MSGISYSTLVTQIRNYTEVDANVLTTDQLENIILNAQQRIFLDVSEDRGEPSGYFVRNELRESIEELESEKKVKVVGIIYDGTYNVELITKKK